jgi:molybdate transport system substrate-binding protein
MRADRRTFLAAVPAVAVGLLSARTARAAFSSAPDVTVFAEPTLAPVIGAVGDMFRAKTGAPVHILTAPSPMLIKEIPFTLDDVMILQSGAVLDAAVARKAASPDGHVALGQNHLVVARRGAGPVQPLAALPIDGPVAIVDEPMPDGLGAASHEVLRAQNWPPQATPGATRIIGVARGADALYLLRTGAAALAVVWRTDVAADPTLSIAATLPDPAVPVTCAAAPSASVSSRFAAPFLEFLKTPEAVARLRAGGLEIAT